MKVLTGAARSSRASRSTSRTTTRGDEDVRGAARRARRAAGARHSSPGAIGKTEDGVPAAAQTVRRRAGPRRRRARSSGRGRRAGRRRWRSRAARGRRRRRPSRRRSELVDAAGAGTMVRTGSSSARNTSELEIAAMSQPTRPRDRGGARAGRELHDLEARRPAKAAVAFRLAISSSVSGKWQAASPPAGLGSSSGSSTLQSAVAAPSGSGGESGRPAAGRSGEGTSPARTWRRLARGTRGSGTGTAAAARPCRDAAGRRRARRRGQSRRSARDT